MGNEVGARNKRTLFFKSEEYKTTPSDKISARARRARFNNSF